MIKTFTTAAIAKALDAKLIGKGNIEIESVSHPADAQGGREIVIATDKNLLPLLKEGKARVAVISEGADFDTGLLDACIIVSRPRYAMAKLTNLFATNVEVAKGVHPTAIIEPEAKIGYDVSIGAHVYVCSGAVIGAGSVLHPQVYVAPDASVGAGALIYSGVRIGARVRIGERCIIHFNSTIGADGFSFVTPQLGSVEAAKTTGAVGDSTNNELVRIASLGTVIIGDDVEIGANTSIDRGTIAATCIGNGTKIDNQVQIGHNVVIGDNCLICGRVGIAGSAKIGNRVVLGGASGVADHVIIGDDAVVMGMSGVAGNIPAKSLVGGTPARPRAQAVETIVNIGRIKSLIKKIESLTSRMDILERGGKTD